jgi:pimeloyl-ACP methyl ester carboxylesterase
MMRIAAAVLATLVSLSAAALAQISSAGRSSSISVVTLDPFLVDTGRLGNIGLSTFLAGNPALANYAAQNLSADGTSAAIGLAETDSLASVTFTVSGPATLLHYSDSFLLRAPQTGRQSLTVSGAALLHINAHYYAPVLVQGPLSGFTSPGAISLVATQGAATANAGLNLVIPPVVLVHGLWGDQTSLSNVHAYLDVTQPWSNQTKLVAAICYSKYLAFDANKDPLTNGGDPCEVTSHAALQSEIDGLLAELDSEHTVGARVDLVAHSMGGLVARNYASKMSYASARNRMLGQFHTIVTLDTPETGSLLANYLIRHRASTRQAPIATPQGLIWNEVCGSADVETCFAALGNPLSAPTLPIDTGAVYSLEPASPSLTNPNLSGPNIAHATWRAISATAPRNSALAFVLDTLISALYPNPFAPSVPTVNSLLKNLPNDAIVSVASQTAGAQASQFFTFSNLSHTSLGPIATLLGHNLDDNSVVDDPSKGTYSLAACWLSMAGADSCIPAQAAAAVTPQGSTSSLKPVDRIRIQSSATAELGKPTEIAVRVIGTATMTQLTAYELGEMGRTAPEPVSISRLAGNIAYIDVTPRLLGPVTVGIRAQFSDGGVSVQQTSIYVKPPKSPPLAFQANDLPAIVLTLNADTQISMPHPFALYPAPVGRVDLNAAFVTYRLVPQRGTLVVAVQKNGLMQALAPGRATVEAQFGSAAASLNVIVRASQQ